jgi:hypothetical protein
MDALELVNPELRPLLALFPTRQLTRENLAEARLRALPIPAPGTAGRCLGSAGPGNGRRAWHPGADVQTIEKVWRWVVGDLTREGRSNQFIALLPVGSRPL